MSEAGTPGVRFDLTGKVALITGGSRGLGHAMALGFARAGADIAIASRKLEACEAAAKEVEALGRAAFPIACHVADWDSLEPVVDAVYERFGRIDVLVNNAGMSPIAPSSLETSEALYDKVAQQGHFALQRSHDWWTQRLWTYEGDWIVYEGKRRGQIDGYLYYDIDSSNGPFNLSLNLSPPRSS